MYIRYSLVLSLLCMIPDSYVWLIICYVFYMILSSVLNSRILKLAPAFEAKDLAPDTFELLNRAKVGGRLIVWAGASDATIYGSAHVNHAFRAWHDSLHLKLNADFTLEGELLVAKEQARILGCDALAAIVLAEVEGQAAYFNKTGAFPVDQVSFMVNYLKGVL